MLEFLGIINTTYASGASEIVVPWAEFSIKALVSIIWLLLLFLILITEKVDKTLVSILIAGLLVFLQVFTSGEVSWESSQHVAGKFIYENLDIFAFIIGMMMLSGMAKESWIFKYVALKIVKKVNWNPIKLFFIFAYMAFFMTIFIPVL